MSYSFLIEARRCMYILIITFARQTCHRHTLCFSFTYLLWGSIIGCCRLHEQEEREDCIRDTAFPLNVMLGYFCAQWVPWGMIMPPFLPPLTSKSHILRTTLHSGMRRMQQHVGHPCSQIKRRRFPWHGVGPWISMLPETWLERTTFTWVQACSRAQAKNIADPFLGSHISH